MSTALADVIANADVFGQWVLQRSTKLSNIDTSIAVVDDLELIEWARNKGSKTFEYPRYNPLDRTATPKIANQGDGIAFSGSSAVAAPLGITSFQEKAVRSFRNQWWSASALSRYLNLNQSDPIDMILADMGGYWSYRNQVQFLSTWQGVFADNDLAPAGDDTHDQFDLTHDVSGLAGGSFDDGVTNFTAENYINARQKMGDHKNDLAIIITHSVVEATMEKGDLLDYVKDSTGGAPSTYRGLPIIINDEMTKGSGNVYHTYIFGRGSTGRALVNPPGNLPVERSRHAEGGNGSGQDVVWSRICSCYHPYGYQFVGSPAADGGPTDAELATAANWSRRDPERKRIKAVRLITREA
jgi:hypothetical protein